MSLALCVSMYVLLQYYITLGFVFHPLGGCRHAIWVPCPARWAELQQNVGHHRQIRDWTGAASVSTASSGPQRPQGLFPRVLPFFPPLSVGRWIQNPCNLNDCFALFMNNFQKKCDFFFFITHTGLTHEMIQNIQGRT